MFGLIVVLNTLKCFNSETIRISKLYKGSIPIILEQNFRIVS